MKKILQLREKILKQDFLNSDIMKITEAISNLDDTYKEVIKDKKMKKDHQLVLIQQEIRNVSNAILNYAKKNKTTPLEIQQLVWAINDFSKNIYLFLKGTIIL